MPLRQIPHRVPNIAAWLMAGERLAAQSIDELEASPARREIRR
jgi:hypothetical protein